MLASSTLSVYLRPLMPSKEFFLLSPNMSGVSPDHPRYKPFILFCYFLLFLLSLKLFNVPVKPPPPAIFIWIIVQHHGRVLTDFKW